MVKPLSDWETVMWGSVVVMLVGAVITAVVQKDQSGTWGILLATSVMLFATVSQRQRVRQRSTRS